MTAPILAAAVFCIIVTVVQLTSIAIAIGRFRARRGPTSQLPSPLDHCPSVSLIRPLCGIDNYAEETLSSTFALDYPHCEILFCVASAKDPVVPFVRKLMAAHPARRARLLVGDDRVSPNPKLNNVVKGWDTARNDWIIIADSNVLMPRDYVQRLFVSWRSDTGLVASPPVGCRPDGIWAEVECAFLNTYQARWQYVVDTFGFGFAQGKTMLWRRADLEAAGGIETLGKEVAEDAAATKVVRGAGHKVRLVDHPFVQPLGRRSAAEVWNRQIRWARLRRASFLLFFLPEVFSGGVIPTIGIAFLASAFGLPLALCVAGFAAAWYGAEMALAAAAGWYVSPLSPLYGFIRDLMLPVLFVAALRGNDFVWRGNEMQVERMQPRRMIARVRPRVREFATGSRRRLRSLRERMSS
ncbi:MAG TPA: ceramide glucosyltransferase [Xanthobacteraceae bacterium]|nr:ceramide glucosyltransferase [Xanthobacteraceae bacterium]